MRQKAEEQNTEYDEDVDHLVDQLKNEEDTLAIGEVKEEETEEKPPKKDKTRTKSSSVSGSSSTRLGRRP